MDRRSVLAGGAALLSGCAGRAAGPADPHPASERVLTRVALGSCANQRAPQPIWDAVLDAGPDLFVFLGDNVYGDSRDPAVLAEAYAMLAAQPGFARLRERVPIAAIWDDHDYGENDAGAEYPAKEASRRLFLDFWGEAAGPRAERDGIWASYAFGEPGRRVRLVLPDLRSQRTALRRRDLGVPYKEWAAAREGRGVVAGPYGVDAAPGATMLGEAQWGWLERALAAPAEVRIVGSGVQVLAEPTGWEGWANFGDDRLRLLEVLWRTRAGGVVFASGDLHWGEVSRMPHGGPYPLWELTTSGLTETWPVVAPNDRRVGDPVREANFGVIEIGWAGASTALELRLHGADGGVRRSERLRLADLQPVR
jgi:alkaline phosphatase D